MLPFLHFYQFCAIAVNSGEGEVARLIQRERECLRPDQFFDVDMVPLIIIMMMGIDHEMCTDVQSI